MKKTNNPLDFYDIDPLLSEEEKMVRDSVRKWVDERWLPVVNEHFKNETEALRGQGLFKEERVITTPQRA